MVKTKFSRIPAHFADLPDPFLCDDCQKLRYCKRNNSQVASEKIFNLREYINMVPLRAETPHLQKAYDAFHQQDYETTILLLRMALSNGNTEDGVYLGLALSYFFEGDYGNASYFIYYFSNKLYGVPPNFISSFIDICNNKINEEFKEMVPSDRKGSFCGVPILAKPCH